MTDLEITEQQRADLEIARGMASAGIPLFLAQPAAAGGDAEFYYPPAWESTEADPSVVDRWRPGMALCAVQGHLTGGIDIDPRHGGDVSTLDGFRPNVYAVAETPSDGLHLYTAPLGCGSRDEAYPGIDVKSGRADGEGRGFLFIAPTVRRSKLTGQWATYRWLRPPDMVALAAAFGQDTSGAAVAAHVTALLTGGGMKRLTGPDWWRAFRDNNEAQPAAAANRAINTKLAEVADHADGSGENFRRVLLRAALTLGGYVGGDFLEEEVARKRLNEAICAKYPGGPDARDDLWVQQGLSDGARHPFHVYTPEDAERYSAAALAAAREGELPPADDGSPPEPPFSVFSVIGAESFDPAYDSSDQGLAKAVTARMFPVLRYATDAEVWVVRGRDVWRQRGGELGEWAVAVLAELMPLGDPDLPKKKEDYTAEHRAAARRTTLMSSAGAGRISRKMRSILNGDHPSCLEIADLDANPEVLWAGGVPWDLRTSGEVPTPAHWVDRGTPHLRSAMRAPDQNCPTPRWDAFTAAVWPDPEVRAWALRVLSIALTGYPDAALPMLYGPERSGKTSMIQILTTVLGSYGHAASPKLLSAQDNAHPEIVFDLMGRRLSFIDEGPRRGHDATERLKQITGGGFLTGRAMRANSVTFAPSHTLVMTTNDEPHLTDPALRARMRLIPCNATESDVRPARMALLGVGMAAEAPGILAALMRETAGYLAATATASNASAPGVISDLVQQLADEQDPIREWVTDCTVPTDPGTPGRALYRAFCTWHQDSPVFRKTVMMSETFFGKGLSKLGYPPKKTRGAWYRPLSVLSGPAGIAPWEPMPDGFTVRGAGPSENSETSDSQSAGAYRVEGRLGDDPANQQNPRSTAVISSYLDGLASNNNINKTQEKHTQKYSDNPTADAGTDPPAAIPPPTLAEVAARASSANLSRVETRKLIKAEARLASILSASGEVLSLPAVVDRNGTVLPVTLDQSATIVRGAVQRSAALTVDVETTGYPIGHADYALRTVQLGDATAAVVLDPIEHASVIRDLLAAAPALHAHSATADLVPLAHAGLIDAESGWERMHDTVIPAKLADPASTGSDPGLKQLSAAVLGDTSVAPAADAARSALFKAGKWLTSTKVDTPVERSGWAQVDPRCATMLRYAASDVLDTAALAAILPRPAPGVYERERLAQRMTARVAHHGIRLDPVHIAELTAQHTAARNHAGAKVRAFDIDNPGSDAQVGRAASALGATLPQTPSGRPSVAAGVLEPLRGAEGDLGELVGAVLDYRHADTALGLFLEPYRVLCDRGDGRARPTVYTLGADTGRMTSTRPNIQQLPREGGMRACLTADEGQLMIGADFSGVEIRVAAALSQDPTLMQMLVDGRDLHAEIARLVWGPDATKAHRYKAKPMVFQRLYGGGAPGMAHQAGVPLATAQAVIDALDALTPRLAAWSRAISDGVRAGHVTFPTYAGRVIHLPRDRPHAAPNFAIQGSARELLVDALVRWRDTRWGTCVLIPVHDELDVFVPAADAEEASRALVACMETTLYGVRIAAEPSVPAFAWADSV